MAPATSRPRFSGRGIRPARLASITGVAVATGMVGLIAVPDVSAATASLRPFVDCIQATPEAGIYTVYFGYENEVPQGLEFGDANVVAPGLGFQGQPTDFNKGYYPRVFSALFNANAFSSVSWHLNGQEAVATTGSRHCVAGLTAPASDLTSTSATLNGMVVPDGVMATYTFEYGPTPSYGQTVAAGEVTGTGPHLVQATLTGLSPDTRYYFRLSSTGATGTTTGAELNFTTLAPQLAITTQSVAPGRVHRRYAAALTAAGGVAPYRWRKVGGSLPAGLWLNTRTGAITGIPRHARTSSFTIKVTDSNGVTATRTLSIAIARR